MPGGIVLILVIVLWLFVLAPLWLRGQKPIRKAGEAFGETRVVYEGGSKLPADPMRRRSVRTPAGNAAREEAEDYELVAAEEVVVDHTAYAEAPEDENDRRAPVVDGRVVRELEPGAEAPVADVVHDIPAPTLVAPQDEEAYLVDETFTSPEDFLYPDPGARRADIHVVEEESAIDEADDEAVAVDAGTPDETTRRTDGARLFDEGAVDSSHRASAVSADAQAGARDESQLELTDDYLTAEDREFAAARAGRGGWDPEVDEQESLTRYQRRQRTLIGLGVAVLVSVVLGSVVGGWTWLVCAFCLALTGIYLWALHSQVRQEQALRVRRIKQLRRARLGVHNRDDEELQIPRALRRPGAVVVELDDESPDFVNVPTMTGAFTDDAPEGAGRGASAPSWRSDSLCAG